MKLSRSTKVEADKKNTAFVLFVTDETSSETGQHLVPFPEIKDVDLNRLNHKNNQTAVIPIPKNRSVVIFHLGPVQELTMDKLRNAGAELFLTIEKLKHKTVHIIEPVTIPRTREFPTWETFLKPIAEGIKLRAYRFDRYKKNRDKEQSTLQSIEFFSIDDDFGDTLHEIETIGNNVHYCRNLVNQSSHESDPAYIAREAQKCSKLKNMKVTVWGRKEIKKAGLGLLMAVNAGSACEPRFVIMTYRGNKKNAHSVALIGKGITFDSGGINLKRSDGIDTMRMDMAGAATVLATMKTAAELALPCNLYGVLPLTDNMLSNNAFRPGDVFTSFNGTTVEIGNTDAEGRLILADALAYTEQKLKPAEIIDLATLTGACIQTFGETVAAFMTESQQLAEKFMLASSLTGEKLWPLPFYDDYDDRMKSDIADISNMSSIKNAGTISAGVFLRHFVKKTDWVHIDIAGTAWYTRSRNYVPKYATGFGVRLLTAYIRDKIQLEG